MPTTQISLIREHTEKIVPPRALWVSFELGRPLGVPSDAAFQNRVLISVLELLEAPSGPVLTDYPEDAPPVDGPAALVCPVNFDLPASEMGDAEKLSASFLEELTLMRPWYDMAVSKRMRTTVGLSGMESDAMGSFVAGFLGGGVPSSEDDLSLGDRFKLAVEDLKSFYFEAATAQPGQEGADSDTLSDWFWRETVAGKVLFAVRDAHARSEDASLRLVVTRSLIPRTYSSFSPFDTSRQSG
ncbi:MAG TPA: hypothetical protein DCP37_04630 [Dehalococcoidia bacterium]|nr:hypothetical protein [SAR202 cluster bacterium]HAL47019.1 hypothetical protein [Dehalococcoidia bacterium]